MFYKKLLLSTACVLGVMSFVACSDDDDDKTVNVPKDYISALASKFPEAKKVSWEQKSGYMVADIENKGIDVEVWFGSGAQWAMSEYDYGKDLFYLPPVVENSFASGEYGSWTVDDINYYERPTDSFYEIEVEKPSFSDTYLYYSTDGQLLKATTNDIDVLPSTSL